MTSALDQIFVHLKGWLLSLVAGAPNWVIQIASSAAWVGEKNLACEQLAIATSFPNDPPLSYGQLRLMPWWDPLRGEPCFEQIVASLAPKETVSK